MDLGKEALDKGAGRDFGKVYLLLRYFSYKETKVNIGNGIIAEAILKGLDPTDEGQRKKAANSLLGKVNWKGTYQSSCDLAETRTEQFCEEITVSKEIVAALLLAAGGKGGVNVGGGGGGSSDDLTNWDGTKRKRGLSRS